MLEQKIEELTAAVRELICTLQNVSAAPKQAEPVEAPVAQAVEEAADKPRRGRPKKVVEPEAVAEATPEVTAEVEEPLVVEEVVTIDTLRIAIRDYLIAGGKENEKESRATVAKTLAKFDVKTLPELGESEYPAVLAALRAL